MGFVSRECIECGESILAVAVTQTEVDARWLSAFVEVDPTGETRSGIHDGYAGAMKYVHPPMHDEDGDYVDVEWEQRKATCVRHLLCWLAAGSPTGYTRPSPDAADQGFFVDVADVRARAARLPGGDV